MRRAIRVEGYTGYNALHLVCFAYNALTKREVGLFAENFDSSKWVNVAVWRHHVTTRVLYVAINYTVILVA